MINKIKAYLKYRYEKLSLEKKYKSQKGKRFIIIGTPNHKNIGDQAIAYAEYKFLKDNFSEHNIIDINMQEYYIEKEILNKYINENDIIILHGGGNLGNEYMADENIRRDVINSYKNNKIILFPQTIYFTNDLDGKNELSKSKSIYSSHKNLTLIAREKHSYEQIKEEFNKNNVILTPDIVLYLNKQSIDNERNGCLLCFRADIEGILNESDHSFIKEEVSKIYSNINVTDMKAHINVKGKERKSLIENKMDEFRHSEIVITDRLHGMVFAAITGTPCIAMGNYNYKVKGTYEWIKNIKYIKYTDNIQDIPEMIMDIKKLNNINYKNDKYIKEYNKIINCIIGK